MGAAVPLVAPRRRAALADGSARGGSLGASVARARGVVMLILSPREPFSAAPQPCEVSPCPGAKRLARPVARMARPRGGPSSAARPALSRFGYAYAYPSAWRFS